MWAAVWRVELRKAGPVFLGWLLGLAFAVLYTSRTLGAGDLGMAWPAALQGIFLAFFLFRESPGTAPFVFSRPFSRARLFWYRWLLGLAFQAATMVVLGALLAFGAREAFQVHLRGSVWYPMVRWHELSVLGTMAAVSLFAYQTTCFIAVRNALLRGEISVCPGTGRFAILILFLFLLVFALFLTGCGTASLAGGPPAHIPVILRQSGLPYLALFVVLTTWSSLYGYRRLEVPA